MVGYDFNKYVSLNADYSSLKGENDYAKSKATMMSLKTEIGYDFEVNDNFAIKPYALLGLTNLNVENSFKNIEYGTGNNVITGKSEYSDTGLGYGGGVRATIIKHMYVDFSGYGYQTNGALTNQVKLSVGAKF